MVYISKERELFGGHITLHLLVDGKAEASCQSMEEAINADSLHMIDELIFKYAKYILKHPKDKEDAAFIELKNHIIYSTLKGTACERVQSQMKTLEQHLPLRGKHKNACRKYFKLIKQLIKLYEQQEGLVNRDSVRSAELQ